MASHLLPRANPLQHDPVSRGCQRSIFLLPGSKSDIWLSVFVFVCICMVWYVCPCHCLVPGWVGRLRYNAAAASGHKRVLPGWETRKSVWYPVCQKSEYMSPVRDASMVGWPSRRGGWWVRLRCQSVNTFFVTTSSPGPFQSPTPDAATRLGIFPVTLWLFATQSVTQVEHSTTRNLLIRPETYFMSEPPFTLKISHKCSREHRVPVA